MSTEIKPDKQVTQGTIMGHKIPSYIDTTAGRASINREKGLTPPNHSTSVSKRRDQLEKCAASFRLFAELGFDEGLAGHISVRDPEYRDHFWVNPLGLHFSQVCVSDLVLLNTNGEVVQGDQTVNQAAFTIHSSIHSARPDINAAAHSHSIYGRSFSTLGKKLQPISQDACAFYQEQGMHKDFSGIVLNINEGELIANNLGKNRVLILQNHGLLTTGADIDSALWLYIAMEKCCESELLANAAGKPKKIPHAIAKKTKETLTHPNILWASAQPLLQRMINAQPDLLD